MPASEPAAEKKKKTFYEDARYRLGEGR